MLPDVLVYDDTYHWEGWGGKLQLGSGNCRLRIYDLTKGEKRDFIYLRSILVVATDVAGGEMSIRSCASHIATKVTADFHIDPNRMLWIEYYPGRTYGIGSRNRIPERYELVEFTWVAGKAIKPNWRPLEPLLLDRVKALLGTV